MLKCDINLLSVVGLLSDAAVHCGDVLNIYCNIGLALHITRCQLQRTDISKERRHQHPETCPEYQSESMPSTYIELQKTMELTSLLGGFSESQAENCRCFDIPRHHHQLVPCSQLQTECKTPDLCVKTQTSPDTSLEVIVDSWTDDSKDVHHHRGGSPSSVDMQRESVTGTETMSASSILEPASNNQTNSRQHHLRCHYDADCGDPQTLPTSVSHFDVKDDWFYVDRAVVGQLNDVFWVDSCIEALQQLLPCHRRQLIVVSQTPSMFPVAALRLGLVSSVCFLDLDPVHRPLIRRLLSANGVSERHVTYGRPWQLDVTSVLFADIVSSEGCLRQNVFELLSDTRFVSTENAVDYFYSDKDNDDDDDDDDDDYMKVKFVLYYGLCQQFYDTAR